MKQVIDRNPQQPIAIVGLGSLAPDAVEPTEFWRNIIQGRDFIRDVPPTHWLIEDYYDSNPQAVDKTYCKRGAFIPTVDFEPLSYGIPPNTMPAVDTSQLLALLVAKQVLQDATNGAYASMDLSRVSVILGSSTLEAIQCMAARLQRPVWIKMMREYGLPERVIAEISQKIADCYTPLQENTFPGLLQNVIAGRIANRFNLGGTNCVSDAACAGSLSALTMAIGELQTGAADMVIAGGVDTLNDIVMFMCFAKTQALSLTEDCRPFSDKADGTVLGEAIVMFALKRLADAEDQGDKIYAVIRGIGTSSDGRSKSIYAPVAEGQSIAISRAYEKAGYSLSSVELIEGHGTGTTAGDLAEFKGLELAFKKAGHTKLHSCALGSIKSQIGHTKSAAGACGLFKAVMALHHKVLPPTIKIDKPNRAFDLKNSPLYLNTELRPWIATSAHPRRAGVSSFGFGGSNFHVALEEYTGRAARPGKLRALPSELVVFTAQNPNSLIEKLGHVLQRFGQISSLAYFACQTQRDFAAQRVSSHSVTSVRLVVIATDLANLQQKLEQAFATLKESAQTSFSLLQGIYYGVDMNPGKVMMMFPGQGSQYCGMGADLAMAFKACGNVWDNASRLSFNQENSLREIVFPPPTFSFQERQGYEQRLTEPVWAQPALASASMAQFHLLKQLSIKPDCMLGHSFGEITALCAADVMDETALFAIAKKRGELMQQAAPSASAMLSVSYPIEKTLAFIKAHHLAVTPANFNAPNQLVLSGSQEAITMAESLLAQEKINSRRLMVGAAFHSLFMESAYKPFRKFLDTLTFHAPQTPVYANLTAKPYPVKVKQIKEMLAKQLTHPVLFNAQIEYAYEQGVRSFIEVGSNNVLTGLVKQCLGKREFHAIYLDHKGEKGVTALWHALGRMITIGLNPDLMTLWEEYALPEEMPPKSSDRYVVKINGSNYAKPYPRSTTVAKPMSTIGVMPQVDAKVFVLKDRARHSSDNFYHHLSDKENTMSNQTNPYLLQMYQNLQQQLTESYNLYQKAMTESHTQFLNAINYLARQAEAANQTAMQSYPNAHTQPVMSNFNLQPNMPSPLSMHRANNNGFDHGSVQLNSSSQPLPQASIPHAAPPVFNFQQPLQSPQPISHYTNHGGISNVHMNPTVQPLSQSPMSHVAASALNIPSAASSSPEAMGFSGQLNQMNIEDLLLEIVVDKTGYPRQMLTMDMTIETELGIDSIKRVEILSAVTQRIPNLPEINPDKLAQLKTLGDIAAYMREHV